MAETAGAVFGCIILATMGYALWLLVKILWEEWHG